MVEIRIGPDPGPRRRKSKPMNKYEFIAFIIVLALFIIMFIVAILSQPKPQPAPEPAELPHSGHVIEVKGKSAPAVEITGEQIPAPQPEITGEQIPAPQPEITGEQIPAPAPQPETTSTPSGSELIPDVKAIAASISEGNQLPFEEINHDSKENFYGRFMCMR